MASQLLRGSVRATGPILRPSASAAVIPRLQSRGISSTPPTSQAPPAERASQLIDAAPSSKGLITKTGTILLGTGLLATAISQEWYVANEETVVAAGFFVIFAYIAKSLRAPYASWAQGHVDRISGILNEARSTHTSAVKDRISSVQSMKDVVPLTTQLFAMSKETATLEATNFELRQKVALAAELKQVLDSWVRFEQSQKQSEQDLLVKSVVDKVMKGIGEERTQKDILLGALTEIEQLVKDKAI